LVDAGKFICDRFIKCHIDSGKLRSNLFALDLCGKTALIVQNTAAALALGNVAAR
jgi:hypothetical protein